MIPRFTVGRSLVALGPVLFLLALALPAQAAFDAFIRFDSPEDGGAGDVNGESTDSQFPGDQGWIQLFSFDFGILGTVTSNENSRSEEHTSELQSHSFI